MSKEKRNQESSIAPAAHERAAYCIYNPSVHAWALLSPLSCSSTRGLRRRVARRPQRVLNSAVHFTACKAIISISPLSLPPPLRLLGLLSQLTFIYGEWLPQPRRYWFAPVCKGEMFQNLSGQFLQRCTAWITAGHLIERRGKNVNITTVTRLLPHTH